MEYVRLFVLKINTFILSLILRFFNFKATDETLMVDRNKQQIIGKDKDETLNIWAGKWRVPDDSPNVDFSKLDFLNNKIPNKLMK